MIKAYIPSQKHSDLACKFEDNGTNALFNIVTA